MHVGQAPLAHGGFIDYFRDSVFNCPTLAEANRIAALNGFQQTLTLGPAQAPVIIGLRSNHVRLSLVPLKVSRTNRIVEVICPLLPPRVFAKCLPIRRTVARVAGIENNTNRDFKDLEEMLGCPRILKRSNEESRGLLIGPSMAPRLFESPMFLCHYRTARCQQPWDGHPPIQTIVQRVPGFASGVQSKCRTPRKLRLSRVRQSLRVPLFPPN